MKRLFDIAASLLFIVILGLPMLLVAALIRVTSKGPIIYWSKRVGAMNQIFLMPKFRTMRVGTPVLATHLLGQPDHYLTPIGSLLRKLSLDELPQLWSILKGEMSLVGPRPALFNQEDLIAMRTKMGIHKLTPGLTGWAQVNGRDELTIYQKVQVESEYLKRRSFWFDLKILWMTALVAFTRGGVSH